MINKWQAQTTELRTEDKYWGEEKKGNRKQISIKWNKDKEKEMENENKLSKNNTKTKGNGKRKKKEILKHGTKCSKGKMEKS